MALHADSGTLAGAGNGPAQTQVLALSALGLVKRYGNLKALDNVSFHVSEGEAVGVVGPNGAGKTTLFGALAGTFPVNEGRIDSQCARHCTDLSGAAPVSGHDRVRECPCGRPSWRRGECR